MTGPRWSSSEDAILRTNVELGQSFEQISKLLMERTPMGCKRRWQLLEVNGEEWSEEEVKLLKQAIEDEKRGFWKSVAVKVEGRSWKACEKKGKEFGPL